MSVGEQRRVLELYGALCSRSKSFAGKLVFGCGAEALASGLSAAVSIAGGTSLVAHDDVAAAKALLRSGGADFIVNTLDEALRTLKNEIRQKRPLGVVLVADTALVLREMAERGVLPDVQVMFGEGCASVGASIIDAGSGETWVAERGWKEVSLETPTAMALRGLEAQLQAMLPVDDIARRRWLRNAGQYLRGDGTRAMWLSDAQLREISMATESHSQRES